MKCYIVWYIDDAAKSLDSRCLAAMFKVTSAPPSAGLSLGFKCFIAAKLSPNQNMYIINTIVGMYFLDLYTVRIYLKQIAAS
jgi:hypothetical protein